MSSLLDDGFGRILFFLHGNPFTCFLYLFELGVFYILLADFVTSLLTPVGLA